MRPDSWEELSHGGRVILAVSTNTYRLFGSICCLSQHVPVRIRALLCAETGVNPALLSQLGTFSTAKLQQAYRAKISTTDPILPIPTSSVSARQALTILVPSWPLSPPLDPDALALALAASLRAQQVTQPVQSSAVARYRRSNQNHTFSPCNLANVADCERQLVHTALSWYCLLIVVGYGLVNFCLW
jgi:hypothetical protein